MTNIIMTLLIQLKTLLSVWNFYQIYQKLIDTYKIVTNNLRSTKEKIDSKFKVLNPRF